MTELSRNLRANAEAVESNLGGSQFGEFDPMFSALNYSYSWKLYMARRIRAANGAVAVSLLPFAFLFSYILCILTVAKRTLSIGLFSARPTGPVTSTGTNPPRRAQVSTTRVAGMAPGFRPVRGTLVQRLTRSARVLVLPRAEHRTHRSGVETAPAFVPACLLTCRTNSTRWQGHGSRG